MDEEDFSSGSDWTCSNIESQDSDETSHSDESSGVLFRPSTRANNVPNTIEASSISEPKTKRKRKRNSSSTRISNGIRLMFLGLKYNNYTVNLFTLTLLIVAGQQNNQSASEQSNVDRIDGDNSVGGNF